MPAGASDSLGVSAGAQNNEERRIFWIWYERDFSDFLVHKSGIWMQRMLQDVFHFLLHVISPFFVLRLCIITSAAALALGAAIVFLCLLITFIVVILAV
jgi:hypothetical protein